MESDCSLLYSIQYSNNPIGLLKGWACIALVFSTIFPMKNWNGVNCFNYKY